MKKHTKIYLKSLGYDLGDPNQFIQSELGGKAVDLHHIVNRENRIENLIALTREQHQKHGEVKKDMCMLLRTHRDFLIINSVEFDNNWFKDKISNYEPYEND